MWWEDTVFSHTDATFIALTYFHKNGTLSDTALTISRLCTEIEDIEEDRGITLRRIRWTALVCQTREVHSSVSLEPKVCVWCWVTIRDQSHRLWHVICLRQNTIGSEESTFGRIKVPLLACAWMPKRWRVIVPTMITNPRGN